MRFLDLLLLIAENLGRRKARVGLTAVGVVIGTAAVVVLVSLGIGLQMSATEQLYGIGDLTQIQVSPNYGEGGGPGVVYSSVGGGGGGGGGGQPSNQKLLTTSALKELAALPGVESVIARDYLMTGGTLSTGKLETYPNFMGVNATDLAGLGVNAQAGSLVLEKGTAIVGYYVPQNFYDPRQRPGQEPPPPPELVGETLKLTLFKYTSDGQEIRKTFSIKVVGLLAETRDWYGSDYSIYIPMADLEAFNGWAINRKINRNKDSYSMVVVKAANVDLVLDLTDQIVALGYQAAAQQEYVQGISGYYVMMQIIFGGVGAISLLVAAIGIANTMAMAILERTREIGLMKAVGATNRDVLSVFLGEAAGIGLIGGLGGVALGWSAGQIINVLALTYLAEQAAINGTPPPSIAVYTPLWLPIFTALFATLIGLLSGLYPALRAATLIPVTALKYE